MQIKNLMPIPKQKFSLEHVYEISNADGEKKGKVVLLEFLSAGSKLIWDYVGRVQSHGD